MGDKTNKAGTSGTSKKKTNPAFSGKPVSLRSGAEMMSRKDLVIGTLYPIVVERQYDSRSAYDSPVGYAWSLNYDKRIYVYPDNSVTLRKDCGIKRQFQPVGGSYLTPAGESGVLTTDTDFDGNPIYIFTDPAENREEYDTYGRLATLVDTANNSLVFSYEAVERRPLTGVLTTNLDPSSPVVVAYDYRLTRIQEKNPSGALTGSWVELSYDTGTGRLTGLLDSANRTVTYGHDTLGNLVSVTGASGNATYGYVPAERHLATTIDEGQGSYENEYDEQGRVRRQTHGTSVMTMTYDVPFRKTTVTTTITDAAGAILNTSVRTVEFDANGQVVKETDTYGNQSVWSRDANNRITSEVVWGATASGREVLSSTDYEYDPVTGNVSALTAGAGTDVAKTTSFTYLASGDPETETQPSVVDPAENKVTSYIYYKDGYLYKKEVIESGLRGDGTRYTYKTTYKYSYEHGNMNKMSINGPRTDIENDIITYHYDSEAGTGNILSVDLPLSNGTTGTITFGDYDSLGNPWTVTDLNGNVTTYEYDSLGRIKSVKLPGNTNPTVYDYEESCSSCEEKNQALLKRLVLPEGQTFGFEYVEHNLTKILDSAGNSINYTYDSEGNVLSMVIKDVNGDPQNQIQHGYDANGYPRLMANSGSSSSSTSTVNAMGMVVNAAIHDPASGQTYSETYKYDARGRKTLVIKNGDVTTVLGYNLNDDITSVTDANNHTTTYSYDDQGRVYRIISPDTGTTNYEYDEAGNLTKKTDAMGVEISYSYDALNRLKSITSTNGALPPYSVTYYYDNCTNGKGRLCAMADASGSTAYAYSAKGQVETEWKTVQGIPFATSYAYNQNGEMTYMIYPSGKQINYTYANNRIVGVWNNGAILANGITYKPFGGMTEIHFGSGAGSFFGYDNLYRLKSMSTQGGQGLLQDLLYTYTWRDNIGKITDNVNSTRTRTFDYDVHNQLHKATSGLWGTMTWDYDKVGNRLKETIGSIQNNYHYSVGSNRLESITDSNNETYSYDANGNTSGTYDGVRQFVYDRNQRLIQVVDGGAVTIGEYVYNGLGQRVKKTANGITTIFHYDLFGQLIAESDITHGTISDYVYLNGQPLAKIEGTNVYYYHNDHLATPQKMTNSSGAVVWSADDKPFGEVINISGSVTNNLRFPGQYYDQETELHYNYFRDYNPAIGRYISKDPIGLRGGINLYHYVSNNPVNWIDPKGLAVALPLPYIATPPGAVVAASAVFGFGVYYGTSVALQGTWLGNGGIGNWWYDVKNPPQLQTTRTLVPSTVDQRAPNLTGTPESCDLIYQLCIATCDQGCQSGGSKVWCKTKCWIGYLGCLAGNM